MALIMEGFLCPLKHMKQPEKTCVEKGLCMFVCVCVLFVCSL